MRTNIPRIQRKKRIRKSIHGRSDKPRLCVFRSNKHIYAQAVDDITKRTLASFSDPQLSKKDREGKPMDIAKKVGQELGKKLKSLKVNQVVFDRSGYKYHGRVKFLADGVREAGISF